MPDPIATVQTKMEKTKNFLKVIDFTGMSNKIGKTFCIAKGVPASTYKGKNT